MKAVLIPMLLLVAGWFLVAVGLYGAHGLRVQLIAMGLSAAAFIASFVTGIRLVKPSSKRATNVLAAATTFLAGVGLVLLALVALAMIFFALWLKSVTR